MKNSLIIFCACTLLAACGKKDAEPAAATDTPTAEAGADAAAPGSVTESTHSGMNMANMNMGGGDDVASFTDPIDYIPDALGSYHWPVTTSSPQAQGYFDQGMQLRWAYNVNEAARSMAEARRLDPECAMCYWGEAFRSRLVPQRWHERAQSAVRAYAAIEKAVALADDASPRWNAI